MLLNIVSCVSLLVFILMLFAEKGYDYLLPFLIPVFLLAAFTRSSWLEIIFRQTIWHKLNEISMYMYFIHLLIASLFFIFSNTSFIASIPTPILTVAYLFIVFLSAEGLRYGSRKVNSIL